jgi:endo-1,4-beta-xylanase
MIPETGNPAPQRRRASLVLRALIGLVALCAVLTACGGSGSSSTLRSAAGNDFYIGTAVGLPALSSDANFRKVLAQQFNSVTAEDAMKWVSVEPVRGQYDWSGADKIVAFARAHDQKVRGHNLVWHSQLPSWLTGGNFSAAQLRAILKQHITIEVSRYKGKIYAWDVVNEPLSDSGGLRDTMWLEKLGKGYIADAFRWAHAADPKAKLYLNDYGIEGLGAKSDEMYDLVKSLLAEKVPISGVGFETHLDLNYPFPTGFEDNLKRFTKLGVEVAVTELDVRMTLPATKADLAQQADYYRQAVTGCRAVKGCAGVTVWVFDDKYSWIPRYFPGEGAGDLFDSQLKPKPAFTAVLDALSKTSS